jgi:hypothetical protein
MTVTEVAMVQQNKPTRKIIGRHDFVDGTHEFTETLFEGSETECIEMEKKMKGVPGPFRKGKIKQSYSATRLMLC